VGASARVLSEESELGKENILAGEKAAKTKTRASKRAAPRARKVIEESDEEDDYDEEGEEEEFDIDMEKENSSLGQKKNEAVRRTRGRLGLVG